MRTNTGDPIRWLGGRNRPTRSDVHDGMESSWAWFISAAVLASGWLAVPAVAQPILTARPLATVPTSSWMSITSITAHPVDPNSLWLTVQDGRIFRYQIAESSLSGPIGTIPVRAFGERGLLMLVFHPDFSSNGRVFVYRTIDERLEPNRVTEYTCDPSDAGSLPIGTARDLITTSLSSVHNGGWMGFDVSGQLLIAVGDVGRETINPQNLTTSLAGKILRIGVDGDDFPEDPAKNYTIPSDNPFAAGPELDEIWMYGLRNPWRCWYDGVTGDLWVTDVGQGLAGEVNRVPGGSHAGLNFDWPCYEGWVNRQSPICPSEPPVNVRPIASVQREYGTAALTGGMVYRGHTLPRWRERFIFADYRSPNLLAIDAGSSIGVRAAGRMHRVNGDTGFTTFGTDTAGELYGGSSRGVLSTVICGGDFDRNGVMNQADIDAFVRAFVNNNWSLADVNGDQFLDHFDYLDFFEAFETGC
jgi:glucose/arabinose dehydrogenase